MNSMVVLAIHSMLLIIDLMRPWRKCKQSFATMEMLRPVAVVIRAWPR